jgi:hypothetical protein
LIRKVALDLSPLIRGVVLDLSPLIRGIALDLPPFLRGVGGICFQYQKFLPATENYGLRGKKVRYHPIQQMRSLK